jgi:hypothetical protein
MTFNANEIRMQYYELSMQIQDLHSDAALLSETYLKDNERLNCCLATIERTKLTHWTIAASKRPNRFPRERKLLQCLII